MALPAMASVIGGLNTAGSVIGGIGSIVSGVKGLFGGKKDKTPPIHEQLHEQRLHQQQLDLHRPKDIVKGALDANLSPLAVMGLPSSQGAPFMLGGGEGENIGDAMGQIGQGIDRAAAAYVSPEDRRIMQANVALDLEKKQLENEYMRSRIQTMKTGLPPGFSTSLHMAGQGDTVDPRYATQAQNPMGYGDDAPLLRKGKDPYGDTIRVYNDDLGDNEVLQALTAIGLSIPDMVANAGQRTGHWLREKGILPKNLVW